MAGLTGHRILVAEDEFLIAITLEMLLSEAGAEVRTAATVAEAVGAAEDGVDVAVLDVSLADGEVFPAADVLAKKGCPIVFHSGHATEAELVERYPGAHALSKPAHDAVLLETLEKALS